MASPGTKPVVDPKIIASPVVTITRGVLAGWIAGVAQVLLAQVVGLLVGRRDTSDVGPRFIQRASAHTGRSTSPVLSWLMSGVFHFEYSAGWGALYAVIAEIVGWRRIPPVIGGAILGGIVYAAAFSSFGAATQTGAERSPEQRPAGETVIHWTAALSFALTTVFSYRWIRDQW